MRSQWKGMVDGNDSTNDSKTSEYRFSVSHISLLTQFFYSVQAKIRRRAHVNCPPQNRRETFSFILQNQFLNWNRSRKSKILFRFKFVLVFLFIFLRSFICFVSNSNNFFFILFVPSQSFEQFDLTERVTDTVHYDLCVFECETQLSECGRHTEPESHFGALWLIAKW